MCRTLFQATTDSMKMKSISIERLEYMIERLENAVEVCYTAPENAEQGYPYAAGYARSCLQETAEQLKELMNNETGDLY
jgi:hypothetical protein